MTKEVGDSIFWVDQLNDFGRRRQPCFFIIDFEMKDVQIVTFENMQDIYLNFNGKELGQFPLAHSKNPPTSLTKFPIDYRNYLGQFMTLQQHIKYGNTFLLNLTHKTPIACALSLSEIFSNTTAKYKLLYKDEFVMFSPECFVKIKEDQIFSYPMKGTINADLPNAREILLADTKEMAEHYTIVDLIRNDLSQVSKKVSVTKFRYIDEIKTSDSTLLQVSSEIKGDLGANWQDQLGSLFYKLLPAGSISGAPKDKTVNIIKELELIDRGFYTGVAGIFDGVSVDSAVCIRFIEKEAGQLFFRSGCGITSMSNPELEYQEMIDKIYVPIA